LQSEIPGIVESTIYTVVLYKNRFPDLDYSRLQSGLDEVARDNGDVAISYKARLASTYLTYSTNIQITPVSPALDHEYLFRQIAEQLEQKLLAAHID
jgi:chemotaxis response regulator CheB